jgi:hypothetical protein
MALAASWRAACPKRETKLCCKRSPSVGIQGISGLQGGTRCSINLWSFLSILT